MRGVVVPVLSLLLLGPAVPATAAPVSLNEACEATRTLLATQGGSNGTVTFAGSRFAVENLVVDAGAGTYGVLAGEGLRAKDRRVALGYLKTPKATAWFNDGRFYGLVWGTSYEQAMAQATGLPQDCATAAGGLLSQSGATYNYANVSVDISDGAVVRWGTTTFRFGAQEVAVPSGQAVAYGAWLKASQAASLNATLRTIVRTVAQSVPEPTPKAIDALLRASVDPERAVPLKVRTLRSGALLSGRNPYTKTYYAWRVYLRAGEPIARRVAP